MAETPIPFVDLAAINDQVRAALDEAWSETLRTGGFVGGQAVEAFEQEFAHYCQAEHCIGVANGTDALELILAGLDIGHGDEVIVPANTFVATAEAVVRVGAVPVFVDVDPDTALITGDIVRAALTERTAAVMAVHLYGQPVDVDDVSLVTERAGVALIEDAAQAHGAELRNRRVGSLGIAAGFSFYPAKNLGALGDGGAITTQDSELAGRLRVLANHGRSSGSRYEHEVVGRNSRLDGLQASVLSAKLKRLDEANHARQVAAEQYRRLLPDIVKPLGVAEAATSVYHLFVVRCAIDREQVGQALTDAGIGWGLHYPVACHLQVGYQDGATKPLPASEELADTILSLPMHPHLSLGEIERVCLTLSSLEGG